MRRTVTVFTVALSLCFCSAAMAQQIQKPASEERGIIAAKHSEVFHTPLQYTIEHEGAVKGPKWMRSVSKLEVYDHHPDDSIKVVKALKTKLKQLKREDLLPTEVQKASRAVTPQLGTNFLGNQIAFTTPPDNALAISNGGRIVSSDNRTIEYYTETGVYVMINEQHDDFFNDPGLNGNIFDPRLIYDSGADRFIFVILHGSNSANSLVITCFSQTNNPQDGWNVYYLPGSPFNTNSWTDFPQIGVSDNELFISGNMFTDNFSFDQTVLFQVDKTSGYNGSTLNWQIWDDIEDGVGSSAFSLVPMSYGQQGNYGPGIYLASSRPGGGNRITLYEVTDVIGSSNEQLLAFNINVPSYDVGGDALQLGTSNQLDIGDCRMQQGFYLNGTVHAVHGAEFQNGFNGIRYYRIPVANTSATQTETYGESGFDLSYPSVASFADTDLSPSVMIGYLRAGSSIYPQQRVINCDLNMDFGSSTLVRAGQTHVNILGGLLERWGDYSDMQRKHNANPPEVWLTGCFGANNPVSNTYNAWIAEIKGTIEPVPTPVVEFAGDTLVGYQQLTVSFYDSTTNNPTNWNWEFPGGVPATSLNQNPVVVYPDSGFYDVTLKASNTWGSDSLTKFDYIEVLSSDTAAPVDTTDTATAIQTIREGSFRMYPNPVADYELVHFDMDVQHPARINATIFDINGREVKVLFDDHLKPGKHRLSFNKLALPAGQYMVRILSNDQILRHEKLIVQ